MGRNLIETVMGAVVLVVAGFFLFFAYQQGSVKNIDGYEVLARFDDITGIGLGSEVRVGGLKVGVVHSMQLDPKTYMATAKLQILDDVQIPDDSSAAVVSSGLLGDKFIKLEPGGSDTMLKAGDVISFTQSSVNFEELIGKFVFSGGGVEGGTSDKATEKSDKPNKSDEKTDDGSADPDNPFSLGF